MKRLEQGHKGLQEPLTWTLSPSSELTAKYCTLTFINGSFSLTQLLMTF